MARYAAEGVRVVCVTCTGGEHGEIVVPETGHAGEPRPAGRHPSASSCAARWRHLGPIDQRFLGYVDSGMMGTPENDAPGSFWQAPT